MAQYNPKKFRHYVPGTPVYADDLNELNRRIKRLENLQVTGNLTLNNYPSNPVLSAPFISVPQMHFVELGMELKPRSTSTGYLLKPSNIDTERLGPLPFVRIVDYLGFHYFDWDRLFVVESPYEPDTFIPISPRGSCEFELKNITTIPARPTLPFAYTEVGANPLLWSRKAKRMVTGPDTSVFLPFDWHIDIIQARVTCQYESSSSRWLINAVDCAVGREAGSFTSSGL